MNFASDNTAGIAPEILAAIARANEGFSLAYGNDAWTARVERRCGRYGLGMTCSLDISSDSLIGSGPSI